MCIGNKIIYLNFTDVPLSVKKWPFSAALGAPDFTWPGNGNAKKTKTVTGNSTILKAVTVTDDNKQKKTVTQTLHKKMVTGDYTAT